MSKAFTKEDDVDVDDDAPLPARPATPPPITRAGAARLARELAALKAEGASETRRARVLASVLETVLVTDAQDDGPLAGFGCAFVVDKGGGARARYVVVGPDEVDAKAGLVSLASPVGRALLGKRVGDEVWVKKPSGEEAWTVIARARPAEDAAPWPAHDDPQ